MKIHATSALIDEVYDESHVQRFMENIAHMLAVPGVLAVTLHRDNGDFRYEVAEND